MLARELLDGLVQLLYPGVCLLCEASLPGNARDFCSACLDELTSDPGLACPRCAVRVGPHTDPSEGCPACRGRSFPFDRMVRVGVRDGVLREAIAKARTAGGGLLAEALGELWAKRDGSSFDDIEAVVPIPSHWRTRWFRGHTLSVELAAALACVIDRPCRPECLYRMGPAPPRGTLERAPRGIFRVRRPAQVRGQVVLLVDDWSDSGGTMMEAARVLRQAGANRVTAAVLAR